MEAIRFEAFDRDFLNHSWQWINDPEIKRLIDSPDISQEQQLDWFHSLATRNDYKVWGLSAGNTKIGVVGLKKISGERGEYFGYIGNKSFWNKGISKNMIDFIYSYAKQRGLKKLWLTVGKDNPRAIRSYEKYGFAIFDENEQKLFMELEIV